MLEVVDELERNGQNLQHFSRELSRYFRNLLVARIAGADTRLVAASAAQREKLADIAGGFSEEDLTRYLQLSLDLFSDLQFSLQPRFHLEIGLVRLVQAGRLLPIEQALAGLSAGCAAPRDIPSALRRRRRTLRRACRRRRSAMVPPRTGPSPFELDRAKKAGMRPPSRNPPAPTRSRRKPKRRPMTAGRSARAAARLAARKGSTPTWPTPWRMPPSPSPAAT